MSGNMKKVGGAGCLGRTLGGSVFSAPQLLLGQFHVMKHQNIGDDTRQNQESSKNAQQKIEQKLLCISL
jgi:hypothetical protein